jgi:hypothetical protein
MKRLLVLTTVLMLVMAGAAMAAESPIDKGSLVLGGTASYSSYGGDGYKVGDDGVSMILLAPSFGYFVSPGLEIGGQVVFTSVSVGGESASSTLFGPQVGYYFKSSKTEVKGSVYPYVKAFFHSTSYSGGGDAMTSIGGRGGIDYMLSNAVALDAGASFQSDSQGGVSGTVLSIGIGITAFIY